METTKLKLVLTLSLALTFSTTFANSESAIQSCMSIQTDQGGEDFKYGQYVYVTLKDGSQTVGKIVGKKNSKKYYVRQLDGSNRGLVHKKYIRKMTDAEIKKFKVSDEKVVDENY
ncbi:hypothetical protein [Ekhidna sp. To15]|uniref:hypothetical protein n=1 Tax=Ekhidna sp. To15 TaxID=3395267 RepID=UPI003F520253